MSAFLLSTIPTLCSAVEDLSNTNGGQKIDVAAASGTFVFQPSTNVRIIATSQAASYSLAAWHTSAIGANGGEAYGMVSNVSGVYTLDTSALVPPAIPTVSKTNASSADFTSPWLQPDGKTVANGS